MASSFLRKVFFHFFLNLIHRISFHDTSSMLSHFLINITLHAWKKWQYKSFIYWYSPNWYRNLCAVNYTTLMFSQQNNRLLLAHDKRCLFPHWPAAFQFEFLTNFVELHVVAGRSRSWADRPQAVCRRMMLTHAMPCRALPHPCRAVPWPWEDTFRTEGARVGVA